MASPESSFIGESLVLDDGIALCYSRGFFGTTKDGMFVGWILGVILFFRDGIVLGSNVVFVLEYTDGEICGYVFVLTDGFIVD